MVLGRLLNVGIVDFFGRGLFMIGGACGVDIAASRLWARSRSEEVGTAIELAEYCQFSFSTLTGECSGKKCSPHSGMLVKETGLSGPASVGFLL